MGLTLSSIVRVGWGILPSFFGMAALKIEFD